MTPTDDPEGTAGAAEAGAGKPASQRRRSLRAVFAADIAGFSGRMSLNETNTVNALSEIRIIGRRELEKHNGWLFGLPGDGLFATFESAVSAVQCALDMQLELVTRTHLQETPLRIGIHLGEVIIEDDLPYGETLNIAARLESLADPGGILVSGTVMDAVSARVSATFEDRGVPVLKNIPRRIPTFAVKQPPARSPADETQAGLSNLDRTTRLDRSAIRDILNEHKSGSVQPAGSLQPGAQAPSSVTTHEPAAPVSTAQAATGSAAGAAMPQQSPVPAKPEVPPPADQGAVEKPVAEMPPSAPSPPQPGEAPAVETPYAPVIAELPLERTLPEIAPVSPPVSDSAVSRPSTEFLEQITTALAVHVGPFAKLIVGREMKSDPNTFELISKLEQHIPNDDERLIFRVRASHINAPSGFESGSGADS